MINPETAVIELILLSLLCSIIFVYFTLGTYALEKFNSRKHVKLPIFLKKHFYKYYVRLTVKNNKQAREYIRAYGYPWEKK